MKMATENLKGEQQRRLEARKNYIEQQLKGLEDLNAMNDGRSNTIDGRGETCDDLSSSR